MKVALVGDTHWGCRNDNPDFYDYQKQFFHECFFPYVKKHDIKHVIHLGDLVEKRVALNYRTGERLRKDFLEPASKLGAEWYFIVGNHDSFHKSSIKINALQELRLQEYGFQVIQSAGTLSVADSTILLCPWICLENKFEIEKAIEESKARYCIGHFEFKGFEQSKGRLSKHGDETIRFGKFDHVFSGHFHIRSNNGNISYIGSCFHFTWDDFDTPRGFAVLETDTGEVEYLDNPYKMFSSIEYDEDNLPSLDGVKNTYCRMKVTNKKSEAKFKDFEEKITQLGVCRLQVIDQEIHPVLSEICVQFSDTRDVFVNEINALDFSDKEGVLEDFDQLYQEALLS